MLLDDTLDRTQFVEWLEDKLIEMGEDDDIVELDRELAMWLLDRLREVTDADTAM